MLCMDAWDWCFMLLLTELEVGRNKHATHHSQGLLNRISPEHGISICDVANNVQQASQFFVPIICNGTANNLFY